MVEWPKETPDQKEIFDFFGDPGENQVLLDLPFPMRISWAIDKRINRFYCHEKVRENFLRIYKAVLAHYGYEEIKRLRLDIWGGCFNIRKKRGGNTYSLHSWGIAIDTDPINNQLTWGRDKARLARPDYDKFWEIVEAEGFTSLGRKQNFDWMHFQATSK